MSPRRLPPLPVRDGLGPARLRLQGGNVADEFERRFGPDGRAKVLAGEVVDADGTLIDAAAALPAGAHVFLYRELPDEVEVPFDVPLLYRDENIVVVDKPHFLATMPRGRHVAQTALVRLRRKLDLPELLQSSDIISIHARVTKETTGMMGQAQFAMMKPGAYFINTARGPLVDYDALYNALASGHLGGAGLDTFSTEPPPADWPLLSLPNVTLTPHIAGCSRESAERGAESVAIDLANFLAGKPVKYAAN